MRIAGALIVIVAASRAQEQGPPRIVNLVEEFARYHAATQKLDADAKRAGWDAIEKRHQEFFDHVLYRKQQGVQREKQKRYCQLAFWTRISPKMDAIRTAAEAAPKKIRATLEEFKRHLPDFDTDTDFYVTLSFTFRGKVVNIGKRNVFAIGMEHFADPKTPQLPITIAHELFHLYHFKTFRVSGGLYRPLWAEGMAVYASAVVIAGHKASRYLGFDGAKMNKCAELLPKMAGELRKNMGSNDPRLRRIYFGAEANDTAIPPEAGYYVGLEVIRAAARNTPLPKLARLSANDAWKLIERELKRIESAPR